MSSMPEGAPPVPDGGLPRRTMSDAERVAKLHRVRGEIRSIRVYMEEQMAQRLATIERDIDEMAQDHQTTKTDRDKAQ